MIEVKSHIKCCGSIEKRIDWGYGGQGKGGQGKGVRKRFSEMVAQPHSAATAVPFK